MAIPEAPEVKGDAAKVLRWLNTILISAGGVLALAVYNNVEEGRKEGKTRAQLLEDKFIMLDKEQAVINANRYTSGDHIKFSDIITTQINANDKRITKLEDSMTNLKDGQNAMQQTLNTIRDGLGLKK